MRKSFIDFAFRTWAVRNAEFFDVVTRISSGCTSQPIVLHAYPHELSGGMRQRVAIALATVCRPEFIIADEPTTALDVVVQKDVLAMIREAQREIGSSMIFVTHDLTVHANISDRLGIMYAGRLVEEAPTREHLARSAASLYAASGCQPAADRRSSRQKGALRRAAEPRRTAERLPLPSALPAGDGHLPRDAIPS